MSQVRVGMQSREGCVMLFVQNAHVMTLQFLCPGVFLKLTGSWRESSCAVYCTLGSCIFIIFLLFYFNTNSTQRGGWRMRMNVWLMRDGRAEMRGIEEFHAWRIILDSRCRKKRPSANYRVPWYSNNEEILFITDTRWACIWGCSSSRQRGSCNWARL
jgi:hypothetical protein